MSENLSDFIAESNKILASNESCCSNHSSESLHALLDLIHLFVIFIKFSP